MRPALATFAFALLTPLTQPAFAAGATIDVDPAALATLELKAQHAAVRDQVFLYADLLHRMGEVASRQLSSGSSDQATLTLVRVEQLASLVNAGVTRDTRKLKDAEILMRETIVRLQGALHAASVDDRPAIEKTLGCVDQLESKMMAQVFER